MSDHFGEREYGFSKRIYSENTRGCVGVANHRGVCTGIEPLVDVVDATAA